MSDNVSYVAFVDSINSVAVERQRFVRAGGVGRKGGGVKLQIARTGKGMLVPA